MSADTDRAEDVAVRCPHCGNEDRRLMNDVPDLQRRYCDVCGRWWSERCPCRSQTIGAATRRDDG